MASQPGADLQFLSLLIKMFRLVRTLRFCSRSDAIGEAGRGIANIDGAGGTVRRRRGLSGHLSPSPRPPAGWMAGRSRGGVTGCPALRTNPLGLEK